MFTDVEIKIKKKNSILFTKNSDCLQALCQLISEQRHTALVLWAFDCMQMPLNELMMKYSNETAFQSAFDASKLWAEGKIKMKVAKKEILRCHAVAKRLDNPRDIALCHAIGQGCSTVHVQTHALGLVVYELTAIVIENNYTNYEDQVMKKINFYKERMLWWQKNIDDIEKKLSWADFLIRPN